MVVITMVKLRIYWSDVLNTLNCNYVCYELSLCCCEKLYFLFCIFIAVINFYCNVDFDGDFWKSSLPHKGLKEWRYLNPYSFAVCKMSADVLRRWWWWWWLCLLSVSHSEYHYHRGTGSGGGVWTSMHSRLQQCAQTHVCEYSCLSPATVHTTLMIISIVLY